MLFDATIPEIEAEIASARDKLPTLRGVAAKTTVDYIERLQKALYRAKCADDHPRLVEKSARDQAEIARKNSRIADLEARIGTVRAALNELREAKRKELFELVLTRASRNQWRIAAISAVLIMAALFAVTVLDIAGVF